MRIYALANGNVNNPRYARAEAINRRYDANVMNSRYGTEMRNALRSQLARTDALRYADVNNRYVTQQIPQSVYRGLRTAQGGGR